MGKVETLTIEKNKGKPLHKKKVTRAKAPQRRGMFLDRRVKMCMHAENRNIGNTTKLNVYISSV